MSDEVTFKFEGMDELYETFDRLAKSLPPEQVEPILKQGGKVLQAAAKANAPQGETGNLKKGIVVKYLRQIGDNPKAVIIKSEAQHDHLVEFGHINWRGGARKKGEGHQIGGKGTLTVTPAHPFFRPAIDTYKEPVIQGIVTELEKKVDEGMK
jgi:HK97 gp10 family phage protein